MSFRMQPDSPLPGGHTPTDEANKETARTMFPHMNSGRRIGGRRPPLVALLCAAAAALVLLIGASSAMADFGVKSFEFNITDASGEPFVQAGGHPYAVTTTIDFNTTTAHAGNPVPDQNVKDVDVATPAGFVGDPSAASKCTYAQLENFGSGVNTCPPASQVGTLTLETDFPFVGATDVFPVYNMVQRNNAPAQFAADVLLAEAVINFEVRTGGDYGLTATLANIPNGLPIRSSKLTLWGTPSSAAHNTERFPCLNPFFGSFGSECPSGYPERPMLTMPTACTGPLTTTLHTDSWQEPGEWRTASVVTEDSSGKAVGLTGCEKLDFSPTMTVRPDTTAADSPSGLSVNLHVPQDEANSGLASADLKDATLTLPAGMSVNPAEANGLAACSPAQIEIGNASEPTCPDASKIGSVEIDTPLLPNPLKGSLYLAQQNANPFGSLLAIYLTVEGEGVLIKLAGHVEADPVTGQLTTTFSENPQLPFSDLKLHLFGGPHAALMTPSACGNYSATSTLTPWSGTPAVTQSSPFTIDSSCGGGFTPSFTAGTASSAAGSFSPFVMSISREDAEQQIKGLTFTMPPGLSAKLAGVPECPDAEAAVGTCPEASRIGSVTVASGAGSDPYFLKGSVYLTGPYNGGPFGEAVVVPANAGPFHLGNVVVRGSIQVDPHTAQATIVSDPFPQFVGSTGIPTAVRRVDVNLERPDFTFNPTSCEEMHVVGALTSQGGASSAVSQRFQAGGCRGLSFEPKFSVLVHAHHTRKDGESMHVHIGSAFGDANIHKVHVVLPRKLPSRLSTLKQACTEDQFAENPAGCPAGSFVGHAVAHTPVLPVPLEGPAIFVSHGGRGFPNLDLVLQGDGVQITLVGNTYINPKTSVTTSTFDSVPDVPVESFDLYLPAGPHSALGGNGDMCAKPLYMPTTLTGHNGAVRTQQTRLKVSGCKPGIHVLGHKVKGDRARMRVSVPSAGKLVVKGAGIGRVAKQAHKAKVMTLTVRLSPRDRRAAAKQRLKIRVHVKLRFTPEHGKTLHAQTRLLLR